jgi:hypothetical protein
MIRSSKAARQVEFYSRNIQDSPNGVDFYEGYPSQEEFQFLTKVYQRAFPSQQQDTQQHVW